ncbi:MAG TPA: S8 family serine peptidase [Bacteroidales bacterium]|nr:S8 family serine peptidase [Bacteroidales bacterium]
MPKTIRKTVILTVLLLCFSIGYGQQAPLFYLPAGSSSHDYINNTIILKIKPEYASFCKNNHFDLPVLNTVFQQLGVSLVEKKFPAILPPAQKHNLQGQKYADLSRIYEISYLTSENIEQAINLLMATGTIEYAQPHYIMKPLDYLPDDPLIANQYHLGLIGAFGAWNMVKGDSNMVIGILDWGVDITHPDLIDNIKYNYHDPIDGIDNDNDGYTDNFRGWDMGENDNNPMGTIGHGTFTAGLSSATTDNGTGIAGTGFQCKFLPIKVCNANNTGTMTYESIVYAAEHGCSIINCSWGSTFYTGQYGQDVIEYATINKGALVVAAAGNDNNTAVFFPASYNYVLSVAASDINDHKANFSNYGHFVDITAPGDNVWSTGMGGIYGTSGGTSFSAPIVSGCAALLRCKYPSLSALQIAEKLKVTADIIDTLPANLAYRDLLGAGRINIFSALNDSVLPAVEMLNIHVENSHHQSLAGPGDTVYITSEFINYLAPSTANLKVSLSCASSDIALLDSVFVAGSLATMGTTSNISHPFSILIKPGITPNENLVCKFTITDNNYRAVQYYYLYANKDYIDIDTNKVATTLTSDGALGYVNGNSLQGLGFRYNNGETMLYSGGFIVGRSATQVCDVLYSDPGLYDHDFTVKTPITRVFPPQQADFEGKGIFNDSLAGTSKINVEVAQRVLAWKEAPNDKFILLEYTLKNKNAYALSGLYAGLYADWDIDGGSTNRAEYDAETKTGYSYSSSGSQYAGISLISAGTAVHYAFDNTGENGSINIADGFTSNEKYVALKTNRNSAGVSGYGNDVSQMLSSGPHSLAANDSAIIVFALLAGDHLGDIQSSATAAYQTYYHTGIANVEPSSEDVILFQNEPNPFKENTNIGVLVTKKTFVELSYYSLNGKAAGVLFSGILDPGMHTFSVGHQLPAGAYVYALTSDSFCLKKKMCIVK